MDGAAPYRASRERREDDSQKVENAFRRDATITVEKNEVMKSVTLRATRARHGRGRHSTRPAPRRYSRAVTER
jgi:hypothetical protein